MMRFHISAVTTDKLNHQHLKDEKFLPNTYSPEVLTSVAEKFVEECTASTASAPTAECTTSGTSSGTLSILLDTGSV